MNINILRIIRNQIETNSFNKKVSLLTESEKENLNKIANFAVTWWLKDTKGDHNNGFKDRNIDTIYSFIKSSPISEDNIEKLEIFKYNLGIEIIKRLLLDEEVELHCGYNPDGLLAKVISESNSDFLDLFLPNKSRMTISKEQIWIKEGYGAKKCLAFDIHKGYEVRITKENNNKNRDIDEILKGLDVIFEKINNGELILPYDFTPTNYNFIDTYITKLKDNKKIKKYTY